jgi:hypothetical protein
MTPKTPTELIYLIIKIRQPVNLFTIELYLKEGYDVFITRQAIYYHLNKLIKLNLIEFNEVRKKEINKNRPLRHFKLTPKKTIK